MNTNETQSPGSQRVVRAIRDLLDNPYPWDLVQIRHLVQADFGSDEEAAKSEMVTYCTAQYCEDAMARYLESKRAAAEVVRAHCPNESSSLTADLMPPNTPAVTEQPAAPTADSVQRMVRPVRCWFCNRQMFYVSQPEHEPEVRVEARCYSKDSSAREVFYAHVSCWNAAIRPNGGTERPPPTATPERNQKER